MGAVVVENEVRVEFRGHLLFQLMEEFDELLAAMARQATADDLVIEDIEGGMRFLNQKKLDWPGTEPLETKTGSSPRGRPQFVEVER